MQRRMLLEESIRKAAGLDDVLGVRRVIEVDLLFGAGALSITDPTLRAQQGAADPMLWAQQLPSIHGPIASPQDIVFDQARKGALHQYIGVPQGLEKFTSVLVPSSLSITGICQADHLALTTVQQNIVDHWSAQKPYLTLPETIQLTQLAGDALGGINSPLSLATTVADMARMHTPWLDTRHPLESVTSLTAIHAIGRGVNDDPFDLTFTSSLRHQLGDWRDVTTVPTAIFDDSTARTEFYIERGFQPGLADFPQEAFEEVIENAGLVEADDDDSDLQWNDRTYPHLLRIENDLRKYVNRIMVAAFGNDWPSRLPTETRERWEQTKMKRLAEGQSERALIHYSELSDLCVIMERKDHFAFFKPVFRRRESMQETFRRVLPARHAVCHCGVVTQIDYLTVMTEHARLSRAIRSED
jgi:hypothetical protein